MSKSGLGDIKTIARNDDSGKYYLLFWGPDSSGSWSNGGTPLLYTSTDAGNSWQGPTATDGLLCRVEDRFHCKDDINFVFQPGFGLVDFQLFWEKNSTIPGGYCDQKCDQRRVLGTLVAGDDSGTTWNYSGFMRLPGTPEENDPPELQFYRSRPFVVPGTRGTRVFSHTLLYAPSPFVAPTYGRQPPACDSPGMCHGPHMYEEWWTLARGQAASNLSRSAWRRPARLTKMAPENAYLFAQPGLVGSGANLKMIWIDSGAVFSLPLHRAVGLYAPANARVIVRPAFNLKSATASTKLWMNADAHWGAPLVQGGCDETCAAYVLVELLDSSGNVIDGYNHTQFDAIMDQDAINIPLTWNNSSQLPLDKGEIQVKIWFRAARVYAVYLGDDFNPAY